MSSQGCGKGLAVELPRRKDDFWRLILSFEQGGDVAENGHADKDEQKTDEPKKIGCKTFEDGQAAYKYYKMLLRELTHNQDLNEVCHRWTAVQTPGCLAQVWTALTSETRKEKTAALAMSLIVLPASPELQGRKVACLCSMSTTWSWTF